MCKISFPGTLTALVHPEEAEEGEEEAEEEEEAIVVVMVTKEDVEVPSVVRMDLHANEHS